MPALGAVVGAALGLGFFGYEGAVGGALFGYLLGSLLAQRARIERLEESLERLAAEVPRPSTTPPEPKVRPTVAHASEEEASGPQTPGPPPTAPAASPSPPAFRPEARPARPDPFERLWIWAKPFLTGSSLIVTVGVVVLFFGCAFLLKYAVERGLVPIELRLTAAALGGIVLVVLGWRTRLARPGFGLALQGGGVGILYLTVFASFRLYALVPPAMAFALLFLFVVLSALLAVVQNALGLAALASAGGFLAPVLTSTGEGSHVALFSYYVLLNAGIFAMAWFRSFRLLNLLGFFFTFVVSASWGFRYYRPEYFASTEPFLIVFFLLYVGIAVLFALRQPPELRGLLDGTLVFGVPLAAAVLQGALVRDYEYGLAWSAIAAGAFYVALGIALVKLRPDAARALAEAFLGTGLVFATLAIPFAFENLVTSAFWALEGAAIVWVGVRQDRRLARLSGSGLELLAAGAFLLDPGSAGARAVLNGRYIGATLVALAAILTSLHLYRARPRLGATERLLAPGFFLWGVAWWIVSGLMEIGSHVETRPEGVGWVLLFFAATAALALFAGRRLRFAALEKLALGLLPSLLLPLALAVALDHPFEGLALVGWLVALGTHVFVLRAQRDPGASRLRVWHAGGLWLLAVLAAWEASELVERAVTTGTWGDLMWPLAPLGLILALVFGGPALVRPSGASVDTYLTLGIAPLAIALFVWTLLTNAVGPWDPSPLPYLPLLSPVDLTVLLILACLLLWSARARIWLESRGAKLEWIRWLVAASTFLWMHGVVARTVHFHAGVPFEPRALFDSDLVQTVVAVLWALVGLGSMLAGTRSGMRPVWAVGAALMGAVVLKLFVVDLSHTGTVERIVSFLGVGVLLLVVGYLSPVPPRTPRAEPTTP